MIHRNLFAAMIIITLTFPSNNLFAQIPDTAVKINYTFATSNSDDGKTVYISTVFCWKCSKDHPCNGVIYGKNTTTPCGFLDDWALAIFKKRVRKFRGKEAVVPCVTEDLTMYYYGEINNIIKTRKEVIANYKKNLHKTVILVTFPDCTE